MNLFTIIANTTGCGPSTTVFDTSCLVSPAHSQPIIATVMQLLFAIIGAVAVIMMIVAGIQYIISTGDAQKMARARNTIIYALVGTGIVISAETIIAFMLGHI